MSANFKWEVGLNMPFTVNSLALGNLKKARQLAAQNITLLGFLKSSDL